MAVPEQTPVINYVANGLTTDFPITFEFDNKNDLIVTVNDIMPEIGQWDIVDNDVVFTQAPQEYAEISIIRRTSLERTQDYFSYDYSFRPETVNYDFDRIWRVLQEQGIVDVKIAAKIIDEINHRRTHDFLYDELARVRDMQVFSSLKQYLDTIIAGATPNIFGGVTASIVFANDKESVQTHLNSIYETLASNREATDDETDRAITAENVLDEKINQETDRALDAEQELQWMIDALANGYVGGYGSLSELLTVTPDNPNVVAEVLDDPNHDPLSDPPVLINGTYYWDGVAWKYGHSDFQDAKDYTDVVSNEINQDVADLALKLANVFKDNKLSTDIVTDMDGNKYPFSILSTAFQKILFGVTDKGGMSLGDLELKEINGQWYLSDKAGRTFIRYKDGDLYFMNWKLVLNSQSGLVCLNDASGRTLFRIGKNGTLYATKYRGVTSSPNEQHIDYQLADVGQFMETDIIHELVYGQSLSISTSLAVPIQSTAQPFDNIMFSGGVRLRVNDSGFISNQFSPLVEYQRETPCSGIANGIAKRYLDMFSPKGVTTPRQHLATTTGEGGQKAIWLNPPEDGGNLEPSRFNETIQIIKYAKANADALNKTYGVGSYFYVQGEHDVATPTFMYAEHVRNIKQRFDQHVIDITGQRYKPALILAQSAAHRRYERAYFGACLSQLRMCAEYDDFVMACPIYQLPHSSDNLHLDGFGAWLLGQYLARAAFYCRYMRTKWQPLKPEWIKWDDLEITVGGWNPHGTTLVIDDALCATTENSGFDIYTGTDTLHDIIDNVELIDSTTIKITLTEPAPLNAALTCGKGRSYMQNSSHGGPQTGARTNIRDDHGEYDQVINPKDSTVYKMHNAAVMFQYDRKNGFNSL